MVSATLTVRTCLLCRRVISADPSKPDPPQRGPVFPVSVYTAAGLAWLAENLSIALVVNPESPA